MGRGRHACLRGTLSSRSGLAQHGDVDAEIHTERPVAPTSNPGVGVLSLPESPQTLLAPAALTAALHEHTLRLCTATDSTHRSHAEDECVADLPRTGFAECARLVGDKHRRVTGAPLPQRNNQTVNPRGDASPPCIRGCRQPSAQVTPIVRIGRQRMEYLNFDLHVEPADSSRYRARVTNDPLGESASTTFRLPFKRTQLENLLLKLDPGRTGTRRIAADPRAGAALALGEGLFESVFSEEVLLAWSRSKDLANQRGCGLRLRLMLSDAPAIAGLPWELLYDRRRGSFVALSEKTPVVRYLEVPDPPRPLAVNGSLKILVVLSSPTDLPELDVDGEWRRFKDALAPKIADGTVQLDRLPSPTIAALSKWLRGNHVHVLHFIGHGGYDRDIEDGVLFFTDRFSRRSQVSPNVLGPFLHDHDPLRLVVLNACHSARVDSTDAFSGMAQGLVQQDCTAVVAMQFPISDSAAAEFTGDFYGALADGLPVDQAVTSGRKALLADYIDEWATPVLFLRSPDGRVFDAISSPSVPTYRSGSAERAGDALPALTVATGGEESPLGGGTEDVVPYAELGSSVVCNGVW